MAHLINFIKLIRPVNLLIIVLIQCLIKYLLINILIDQSALSNFNFLLFVTSNVLITAGGYIINDIYDEDVDKINKNKSRIINKKLSARIAIFWYFFLNITALIMIIYVCLVIKKIYFSLIFFYSIFSLWQYSKNLQTSFLTGNLLVSWLIALSIINLGLFDIIPKIDNNNISKTVFIIILIYALFSFLMTFSREIIKDIEDESGDKTINANTLIIRLGLYKTKLIITSLNLLVFILIGVWQYFQYSFSQTIFSKELFFWGTDKNSILYTFLLQILLLFYIVKCCISHSKENFSFLSKFAKLIMIAGILSIAFFTYNQ